MHSLPLKGISLNNAYIGRRFASPALKQFKSDMQVLLPRIVVPEGKLALILRFGVSSKISDADNLSKATTDCIAEAYNFNDKQIYKFTIEKVDVKKGEEFIQFSITEYENLLERGTQPLQNIAKKTHNAIQ